MLKRAPQQYHCLSSLLVLYCGSSTLVNFSHSLPTVITECTCTTHQHSATYDNQYVFVIISKIFYSKTLKHEELHSFKQMFHKLVIFILFTARSHTFLLSVGAQASDPGGSGWLPFRGRRRHRPGDLRVGLGDTGAQPYPVRVVWQHSLWTSAPRRRGQAEGAAQHIGELHDG